MVGGVWNGFLLGKVRGEDLHGLLMLKMQRFLCWRVLGELIPLISSAGVGCSTWCWLGDSAADRMPAHPDVWTDGSPVREVSGSGYARLHADTWKYRRWGHFDDLGLAPICMGFSSLPGPLQTVQRAEFGGDSGCARRECLGVGNLDVVWHVGRLLDGSSGLRSLELEVDGDLVILIRTMLSVR